MMNKKLLFLILLLGLFAGRVFSQNAVLGIGGNIYLPGEIHMANGSTKKGLVQIPKTPYDLKMRFKASENSEPEKVSLTDINSFKAISKKGDVFNFECSFIDLMKGKSKMVSKVKVALLVETKGYASLYKTADEYRTDKNGQLYLYSSNGTDGAGIPFFTYFIKKQGAKYAEKFEYEKPGSFIEMSRRSLVKSMEVHLSEYPALIEKVRKKELDKDLSEIFKLYNEYMAKRK